jgi:hypothetical protein
LINATGYSAAGGRPDQADGKSTASAPAQRRDLADRGVILFIEFCDGIADAPKHTPFARQKPTK